MYDAVAEFAELLPEEKPTQLHALRQPLEIMEHRIDVMPNSERKLRFRCTYTQFKDQIPKKIITELEAGRIVPSKCSNSIGMFIQAKSDKLQEQRFRLDCISRNLVTHKDKTLMPSMEEIKDFIGSRPFRSKLDLTDVCNNIRIYPDSVSDATFWCYIRKFDYLVMQQGDCNAPATMRRAMHYQFREVKDQMIYLDNILIANHTYEQHINTISQELQIAK